MLGALSSGDRATPYQRQPDLLLDGRGSALMPIGRLLVGVGQAQYGCVSVESAGQMQADRHPVRVEATWYRDGGQTGRVERQRQRGSAGEGVGKTIERATIRCLPRRNRVAGRRDQRVDLVERGSEGRSQTAHCDDSVDKVERPDLETLEQLLANIWNK